MEKYLWIILFLVLVLCFSNRIVASSKLELAPDNYWRNIYGLSSSCSCFLNSIVAPSKLELVQIFIEEIFMDLSLSCTGFLSKIVLAYIIIIGISYLCSCFLNRILASSKVKLVQIIIEGILMDYLVLLLVLVSLTE